MAEKSRPRTLEDAEADYIHASCKLTQSQMDDKAWQDSHPWTAPYISVLTGYYMEQVEKLKKEIEERKELRR